MLRQSLISLLVTATCLVSSANIGTQDDSYGIDNMIRMSVNGPIATVHMPYNYLHDNHPAKKAALEDSIIFFENQFIQWAKFRYKFERMEDKALQAELNSKAEGKAGRIAELLKQQGRTLATPNMNDHRALATKIIRADTGDLMGNVDEDVAVGAMVKDLQKQFSTQKALLLNNVIEHSKTISENLKHHDRDFSEEEELAWNEVPKQIAKMALPDIFMIQIHGNHIGNFFSKDVEKKGTRATRWRKYVQGLKINPLVSAGLEAFSKALEFHRYRAVILFRPWVKMQIDLRTGKILKSEGVNPFSYGREWAFNVLANVVAPNNRVHDTRSFRISVGGINGNFDNLNDITATLSGISVNVGKNVNLKAGFMGPASLTKEALEVSKLLTNGKNWGYYYLVGAQRMVRKIPVVPDKPASGGLFNPGGGIPPADPIISPPPLVKGKSGDPKPIKKSRAMKMPGGFEFALMFNLGNAIENIGASYADLHPELTRLIGIKGRSPFFPGPTWPNDDPGNPGIGGNPGIFPIWDDGQGGQGSIFLRTQEWKDKMNIHTMEKYRKWVIYDNLGCDEECMKEFEWNALSPEQ